jgi:sialidase-1
MSRSFLFLTIAGVVVLCTSTFNTVPVFQAYVGFPPCYRQPVLVVIDERTVLAFAEGRNNSYCSGTSDGNMKYIVLRRSLDGGQTWLSQQTIFSSPQIDYLAAVYDPAQGGAAHLMIQQGSATVLHSASADEGVTWSSPAAMNISSNFSSQLPGCGHGIIIDGALCAEPTCGGTAGRIVVPFVCRGAASAPAGDVACPGCYSCAVLSDDHGLSWRVGAASTQDGTRESGIAQLHLPSRDGRATIYSSERNMGANTGYRLHAVSSDSAATFSSFGSDPEIPDVDTKNWTGVVAGVARFDTPGKEVL